MFRCNLVLTFANGKIFEDKNFWKYIDSLKVVAEAEKYASQVDFVLLSDDISDENCLKLKEHNVFVEKTQKLKKVDLSELSAGN